MRKEIRHNRNSTDSNVVQRCNMTWFSSFTMTYITMTWFQSLLWRDIHISLCRVFHYEVRGFHVSLCHDMVYYDVASIFHYDVVAETRDTCCMACWPDIWELYSAVSMRRMYGMMLSICTLPMRPEKNSSSMMVGVRESSGGMRSSSLASRSLLPGCTCWMYAASSWWERSWKRSTCCGFFRLGLSEANNSDHNRYY